MAEETQPDVPILPPVQIFDIPEQNIYVEIHKDAEPL